MSDLLTYTNLFYMSMTVICIIIVFFYIYPSVFYEYILKKKKITTNNTRRVEIPEFDKQEYLRQLFNNAFYSIAHDSNWSSRYWSNSVTFTKHEERKKKNSYDDIPYITMDIKFNFKTEMFLCGATLKSGYECYVFDGLFTNELLDYVYKEYKIYKDKENQEVLENIEKSVKSINNILGKGVERGSKLNDLLD